MRKECKHIQQDCYGVTYFQDNKTLDSTNGFQRIEKIQLDI